MPGHELCLPTHSGQISISAAHLPGDWELRTDIWQLETGLITPFRLGFWPNSGLIDGSISPAGWLT